MILYGLNFYDLNLWSLNLYITHMVPVLEVAPMAIVQLRSIYDSAVRPLWAYYLRIYIQILYPDLKIFQPKYSWQILRCLCACRNQIFFDFSKYRRNYKEYLKSQERFQVLLSTIFYTKSSVKPSSFGSSLASNIFSKRWFLCSDKSHIQKGDDVTACFFYTIKKQTKFPKQPDSYFIYKV